MTQIEQIKAEVKRLMNNRDSRLVDGSYFDFEHLLFFIESLEKEQDGTLAPDDPATNEEVKRMLEQRRIDMLKQVRKECERELQEQYDNGYDDGWKAHEKVIAEYQKKEQSSKIKGWVARGCDGLTIYAFRPKKGEDGYYVGKWIGEIEDSFAPEMTREDEPIEVELTISRVIK